MWRGEAPNPRSGARTITREMNAADHGLSTMKARQSLVTSRLAPGYTQLAAPGVPPAVIDDSVPLSRQYCATRCLRPE